jgi:hypothetical protein
MGSRATRSRAPDPATPPAGRLFLGVRAIRWPLDVSGKRGRRRQGRLCVGTVLFVWKLERGQPVTASTAARTLLFDIRGLALRPVAADGSGSRLALDGVPIVAGPSTSPPPCSAGARPAVAKPRTGRVHSPTPRARPSAHGSPSRRRGRHHALTAASSRPAPSSGSRGWGSSRSRRRWMRSFASPASPDDEVSAFASASPRPYSRSARGLARMGLGSRGRIWCGRPRGVARRDGGDASVSIGLRVGGGLTGCGADADAGRPARRSRRGGGGRRKRVARVWAMARAAECGRTTSRSGNRRPADRRVHRGGPSGAARARGARVEWHAGRV